MGSWLLNCVQQRFGVAMFFCFQFGEGLRALRDVGRNCQLLIRDTRALQGLVSKGWREQPGPKLFKLGFHRLKALATAIVQCLCWCPPHSKLFST